MKEGSHKIIVRINSLIEENSKDNNKAILTCRFPIYGVMVKNIEASLTLGNKEGYPFPWRMEEIRINLDKKLTDTSNYKLKCTLLDYWDKEVKTFYRNIPEDKDFITIKPFIGKKIGWWKVEAALFFKEKGIDKVSEGFSYAPDPQKPRKEAIFAVDIAGERGREEGAWANSWNRYFSLWTPKKREADIYTGASWFTVSPPLAYGRSRSERLKDPKMDERVKKKLDSWFNTGRFIMWRFEMPRLKPGGEIRSDEPEVIAGTKNHVYNFTTRYKGKDLVWEMGGEYNPAVTPAKYARYLKVISEAAKVADPDCKICTSGISRGYPSLLDSGKKKAGGWREWQEQMYGHARGCFDYIGCDCYSHEIPEEPYYLETVKPHFDIIKKFGDLGKVGYWNCEWAPAATSGTGGVADHIVRAYLYQLGMKEEGASHMSYYVMCDRGIPHIWCKTGLIKFNRCPRPRYQAYAVAANKLTWADFEEKKKVGEGRYCYFFKDVRTKKELACLWKREGEKEIWTLRTKGNQIKVTDLMGGEEVLESKGKKIELVVSLSPIYVEGLDRKNFTLLGRKKYAEKITFEDEYPQARKLKESSTPGSMVFYNIAKKKWAKGESGIEKALKEGIEDSLSVPLPQEETVIAKYTKRAITLDGDLSEWKGYPSYTVTSKSGKIDTKQGPKDDTDLSYTFYATWDDTNLYLAFDVTDDVIVSEYMGGDVKAWGGDCIEVYLDSTRSRKASPGIEFSKYYFGLNNEVSRLIGAGGEINAKMVWKKKEGGYSMEIAIPLAEIFLQGIGTGARIAFDIGVDDSDKMLDRVKYQMCWHKTRGQHDAITIGDLLFSGK